MFDQEKFEINGKVVSKFKQVLWELDLNASKFARLSGQPVSTVCDWARGDREPPPAVYWGIGLYKKMLKSKKIKSTKGKKK